MLTHSWEQFQQLFLVQLCSETIDKFSWTVLMTFLVRNGQTKLLQPDFDPLFLTTTGEIVTEA